jgi:hypothetical protein
MKYLKKFEGVADEYAEKKYGFKNPHKDFEYKYQNYIAKIPPVAYVKETDHDRLIAIFKNPKYLTNFEENVRAIGTIDGDLYVAQRDESFYHSMMGQALELVPKGNKIYDLTDKFVFLYRLRNDNTFVIGVSTEYFNDGGEENVKITGEILKKIKRKNPQFKFYNYTKSQLYARKRHPIFLDITEPTPEPEQKGMFTKLKNFIKK